MQRWLAGLKKSPTVLFRAAHMLRKKMATSPFEITLEEEAFYNIFIKAAAPGGVKTNNFVINDMGVGFTLAENPDYILLKVVSGLKLKAGNHRGKNHQIVGLD
jgi:hypothetical protein